MVTGRTQMILLECGLWFVAWTGVFILAGGNNIPVGVVLGAALAIARGLVLARRVP